MEQKIKIPALALLGLSFTQCTGREQAADPIVGDWRAIQVDGEKHPVSGFYGQSELVGEQLRIDDDLAGEMARYMSLDYDGLDHLSEKVADLVVDASGAPKYRIDVHHDLFEVYDEPLDPTGYYYDTGYADTGYADPGNYAEPDDDHPAEVRPLSVPTTPAVAPGAMIFDCTLDADTLTCDREGATELKHWVFTRIEPEGA